MDKRLVPAGLKERDVRNRSNPHFDIVGQEDKIVAMKYARLIPPSGRKRLLGLFSNLYQRTHVLLKGKGFNAIGCAATAAAAFLLYASSSPDETQKT
jgi:hypothetical protein